MPAPTLRYTLLLLLLSLRPISTTAQIIDNLPACWQTCISRSGNLHCSLTDVTCICRASNGNFLPDVITCARGNCDNAMDTNLLLTPLQGACSLLGAPISPAAIRNAENAGAVASVTVTTTISASFSSSERGSTTTTTVSVSSSPSSLTSRGNSDTTAGPSTYAAIFATSRTMTTTTTDAKGDVYVLVLPTETTVTSVTVIYPATTGEGFVDSRSMGSNGGDVMATSTSGALSTGAGAGGSGIENLTAQETNGAPLDYERNAGSVKRWDRWLWVATAAVVLACST